jgi:hypothetical protein
VGRLSADDLTRIHRGPLTAAELFARLGGRPQDRAPEAHQPGSIAGYIELHVEQGRILDAAGIDIGIVEGIVGICQYMVTLRGAANHAGVTPNKCSLQRVRSLKGKWSGSALRSDYGSFSLRARVGRLAPRRSVDTLDRTGMS